LNLENRKSSPIDGEKSRRSSLREGQRQFQQNHEKQLLGKKKNKGRRKKKKSTQIYGGKWKKGHKKDYLKWGRTKRKKEVLA